MHECNADCWAVILRLGPQPGCDEFAARDAAAAAVADDEAIYAAWTA